MDKNEAYYFVKKIKDNIPTFIELIEFENPFYIKFSLNGNVNDNLALANISFLSRIKHIFNIHYDKKKYIEYILQFKAINNQFYDPFISKKSLLRRVYYSIINFDTNHLINFYNKQAETRQSLATLKNLNYDISQFCDVIDSKKKINKYFNNLNWNEPWGASSHINHQLFFLKFNNSINSEKKIVLLNYYIELILSKKKELESKNISPSSMIGSFMKITMGLSLYNKENIYLDNSMLDYCLKYSLQEDACKNFNLVFSLYYLSKKSRYRKKEIDSFFLKSLETWKKYYFEDYGGFSFYLNKSSDIFYSARLSKGLNCPDIHGTAMYSWGLLLISKHFDFDKKLNLKNPIL